MSKKKYNVLFAGHPPELDGPWDGAAWMNIPALEIDCYRRESGVHRPKTQCKLLYDQKCIYGIFRVEDRLVRCVHTGFQSEVYKDSCVEFFVQPENTGNYFNFEFNCGGALLASCVTDPTRIEGRVKGFLPLAPEDDLKIKRRASLPQTVEPEITGPITWFLSFSIPFAVLGKYAAIPETVGGHTWRANFYKCGNETSLPHWGSWSPLGELNFHRPSDFGEILFAPR